MLYQQQTLNCRGQLLSLNQPIVMGIMNLTNDSFYDGGRYSAEVQMLKQVEKMLLEGASLIDVGGMSSRPGAELISSEEESKRVIPAIRAIKGVFPDTLISVDTFRSEVARMAVDAGACMINDISAARMDKSLYATVAELKVPYVLMHMKGTPADMQKDPSYDDVVQEVLDFLIHEISVLRNAGAADIIIDPGFGFGKTIEHNYQLLSKLHVFKMLSAPIMVGISRKSMIYKVLQTSPEEALNGTSALHMIALQQGARILRVHDVREAVEVISLYQKLGN